jgi:hypothetical protein
MSNLIPEVNTEENPEGPELHEILKLSEACKLFAFSSNKLV